MESLCCCWECKMLQLLCKMIWQYLTKLNIRLPYPLTILLLSVFLREMEAYMHKTISTRTFVAVLVITVKICKQLRGSSMAHIFIEWNMAQQKIRSELIQREIWPNLKNIMLRESLTWKGILYVSTYMKFIIGKTNLGKTRIVVASGWWCREWGRGLLGRDMKELSGVMVVYYILIRVWIT